MFNVEKRELLVVKTNFSQLASLLVSAIGRFKGIHFELKNLGCLIWY